MKVFIDDRNYTYEKMVQHLNVIELDMRDGSVDACKPVNQRLLGELGLVNTHFKDGSWKECKCSPEKHLPSISLLAQDGIMVSQTVQEKKYMEDVRDRALMYSRRLEEGQLTDEEAWEMSHWANNVAITLEKYPGQWSKCGTSMTMRINDFSGLASEGIGFTEEKTEKKFMHKARKDGQKYFKWLNSGKLTPEQAEEIRGWARENRRRVHRKAWTGALPKTSRKDEDGNAPTRKAKPVTKTKPTSVGKEEEDCATCTVVPDKYKRPTTVDDVRLVSMPQSRKVTSMSQKEGGSDIRIIEKGY